MKRTTHIISIDAPVELKSGLVCLESGAGTGVRDHFSAERGDLAADVRVHLFLIVGERGLDRWVIAYEPGPRDFRACS